MSFIKNYMYAAWLGGSLVMIYSLSWETFVVLIPTIFFVELWRAEYWLI